jgi:hypothetical protein
MVQGNIISRVWGSVREEMAGKTVVEVGTDSVQSGTKTE